MAFRIINDDTGEVVKEFDNYEDVDLDNGEVLKNGEDKSVVMSDKAYCDTIRRVHGDSEQVERELQYEAGIAGKESPVEVLWDIFREIIIPKILPKVDKGIDKFIYKIDKWFDKLMKGRDKKEKEKEKR